MKLYNLMQRKYLNSMSDESYALLVRLYAEGIEWQLAQEYQMAIKKCSTGNNKSPFQFEVTRVQTWQMYIH